MGIGSALRQAGREHERRPRTTRNDRYRLGTSQGDVAGAWRRPGHPDPVEHAGLSISLWLCGKSATGLHTAATGGGRLQPERLAVGDLYRPEY